MSFNSSLEKVKINLLIFINNNSGGNNVLKELTKLPYIELIILEKNKINKFKLLFKIFKHYYYLRKFKNRIILCSDPILSIILFYSKINFIRFVQGDDLILFNQRVPTFINFIYKKLYKNSLRQKTIVNSDFTKNNLIKVNSKINIIGKCRPGGNFKLIHKHRKYEIVYIYRDAPWKGSEDFFDIIKSLDNLLVTEINILLINYDKSKLPKKFNKIKFDMLPWINKSELNLRFCMSKIILSTTENYASSTLKFY